MIVFWFLCSLLQDPVQGGRAVLTSHIPGCPRSLLWRTFTMWGDPVLLRVFQSHSGSCQKLSGSQWPDGPGDEVWADPLRSINARDQSYNRKHQPRVKPSSLFLWWHRQMKNRGRHLIGYREFLVEKNAFVNPAASGESTHKYRQVHKCKTISKFKFNSCI